MAALSRHGTGRHAILTATQKTKLAELQMDAKKKRAEKADKSKKSAEPAGEEK